MKYWANYKQPFIIENGVLIQYQGPGGMIEIPEEVTAIGDYGMHSIYPITGLRIPDSVTSLGKAALNGCQNCTVFHIPDRFLQGESLLSFMLNFSESYWNQPGFARNFVRNILDGTADYSKGFYELCLTDLTTPFDRKRWLFHSIQLDKPHWVTRIVELNPDITAQELYPILEDATREGRAEVCTVLMSHIRSLENSDTEFILPPLL